MHEIHLRALTTSFFSIGQYKTQKCVSIVYLPGAMWCFTLWELETLTKHCFKPASFET